MRLTPILLTLLFVPAAAGAITTIPKQSGCFHHSRVEDRIDVTVDACALRMTHDHLVFNCCLEYAPAVTVDGTTIEITEVDTGPPCDCLSSYDLELTIADLEPDTYTVVVTAFARRDPLTYTVTIPPHCAGNWIFGPEIWTPLGIGGVTAPIHATHDRPLEGFSFGTTFPAEHCQMADVNLLGTRTEEAGAEYFLAHRDNNPEPGLRGWATCSVVLDREAPFEGQTIPPGRGNHIANLVYDLPYPTGSIPRSISVTLVDGAGDPPVPLSFTVDGTALTPGVHNGIFQITMPPPDFIRGDADGDGLVVITDPIYLLGYLFLGGPPVPCDDAADADDNGALNIVDPIRILGFLFLGDDMPAPRPPGPPGPDTTLDRLGCSGD